MTRLDGKNVGEFAFVDSDGVRRYVGRTCNLYGNREDVLRGFAGQRHRGATIYVYRTVDGLYDGSCVDVGEDRSLSPELIGAELVDVAPPSARWQGSS